MDGLLHSLRLHLLDAGELAADRLLLDLRPGGSAQADTSIGFDGAAVAGTVFEVDGEVVVFDVILGEDAVHFGGFVGSEFEGIHLDQTVVPLHVFEVHTFDLFVQFLGVLYYLLHVVEYHLVELLRAGFAVE